MFFSVSSYCSVWFCPNELLDMPFVML